MKGKVFLGSILLAMILAPIWAQTESDFTVGLTSDGTGVVIRKYNGTATAVKIPATIQGMPVKEIGNWGEPWEQSYNPFEEKNITSVEIPNGVTLIGNSAFKDCSQLTQVIIPDTVTRIGNYAFFGCRNLRTISIPNSVTEIGDSSFGRAFFGSGLTSITLPRSLAYIASATFGNCTNLTSVTIPEGVKRIDGQAFERCSALQTIALPASIEEIGQSAFEGCRALTTITIPNSVSRISFDGQLFGDTPNINLATQAALKRLGYNGNF